MADFTSAFWSWYIIIPTVVGIAALFWLNRAMTTPRRDHKETGTQTTGHIWDEDLRELNNPLPRWWLNLFYITLVFGVIYLVLYPGLGSFTGLLHWSETDQYQREIAAADRRYGELYDKYLREKIVVLAADPEARRTGARLFANYCTQCHGSDARGAPGFPNLRDGDWLWGGDPKTIETTILNGRQATMPAWGPVLGADGVRNVAEYVLSLSGKRVINQAAADAGKIKFHQLCVACHGPEGKGNPALGAPNLTDDVWLYGGSQRTVIRTITYGRNGHMPAHKDFLGPAKVHVLAAYVYGLSHDKAQAETVETADERR